MPNNNANGRRFENRVGEFLELMRVGDRGFATPDLIAGYNPDGTWGGNVLVETKYRKSLPVFLTEPMQQVQQHVKDGQYGFVVFGERNSRIENAMVVMRLADFRRAVLPLLNEREGAVSDNNDRRVVQVAIRYSDGSEARFSGGE